MTSLFENILKCDINRNKIETQSIVIENQPTMKFCNGGITIHGYLQVDSSVYELLGSSNKLIKYINKLDYLHQSHIDHYQVNFSITKPLDPYVMYSDKLQSSRCRNLLVMLQIIFEFILNATLSLLDATLCPSNQRHHAS